MQMDEHTWNILKLLSITFFLNFRITTRIIRRTGIDQEQEEWA